MQGRLDYAIVDEVDSILIDEARTPLIISGPAHDDVSALPDGGRRRPVADRASRQQANRETRAAGRDRGADQPPED